jgi:hypothetical protein
MEASLYIHPKFLVATEVVGAGWGLTSIAVRILLLILIARSRQASLPRSTVQDHAREVKLNYSKTLEVV